MNEFLMAVMPTVGEGCGHAGCSEWSDHVCTAGSGDGRDRCGEHCTCEGEPVAYEVTVIMTLPTRASADVVARRLRTVTGEYGAAVTVLETAASGV